MALLLQDEPSSDSWMDSWSLQINLHLSLTRVKLNVSVFAAVAAFCGGHQRSGVRAATVKLHSTGGVVGGAGRDVAVLSCHLHSVETCPAACSPGEIPVIRPTVHTSG